MFSAKTFLFLTFILTIIVAINSTCPESCDDPEDPVCITMIDGTKKQFKNACEFVVETCSKNIFEVLDAQEGPCPEI
uniref:Putative 6.3 kDa secreted salivary gland protein n=1 Tax=Stomoxys calcitrans TaxID=35570 RepID=A5WXS1_STOCA|nr:putative 6.3 kDa secreted salivary gland protein [Stomoxys calcitrans]